MLRLPVQMSQGAKEKAQFKYPEVGCSAEGHVSHILSARMSSRPMAWSSSGAEGMVQMRAVRASGESIKEHYLARQEAAPVIIELKQAVEKVLNRLQSKSRLLEKKTLQHLVI